MGKAQEVPDSRSPGPLPFELQKTPSQTRCGQQKGPGERLDKPRSSGLTLIAPREHHLRAISGRQKVTVSTSEARPAAFRWMAKIDGETATGGVGESIYCLHLGRQRQLEDPEANVSFEQFPKVGERSLSQPETAPLSSRHILCG